MEERQSREEHEVTLKIDSEEAIVLYDMAARWLAEHRGKQESDQLTAEQHSMYHLWAKLQYALPDMPTVPTNPAYPDQLKRAHQRVCYYNMW